MFSEATVIIDYPESLVLENGTRSRLPYDGGYVSISNSGTAEEYNHYYPLGGPIAQYSPSTSIQPIKFQSKEWRGEKGLTLYDFGARRLMYWPRKRIDRQ